MLSGSNINEQPTTSFCVYTQGHHMSVDREMLIGYLQKRDAPAGFIAAASSSRFSVTPEQRERIRAALAPPDPPNLRQQRGLALR